MIDLVDESYVKGFLNLTDTKHDSLIDFVIPIYTREIQNIIDVSKLTEDQLEDVKATITSGIACHIQMIDPTFSLPLKSFDLGNVSKEFQTQNGIDTWCEFYESLKETISLKYGPSRSGVAKRPGVSSDYPKPY